MLCLITPILCGTFYDSTGPARQRYSSSHLAEDSERCIVWYSPLFCLVLPPRFPQWIVNRVIRMVCHPDIWYHSLILYILCFNVCFRPPLGLPHLSFLKFTFLRSPHPPQSSKKYSNYTWQLYLYLQVHDQLRNHLIPRCSLTWNNLLIIVLSVEPTWQGHIESCFLSVFPSKRMT